MVRYWTTIRFCSSCSGRLPKWNPLSQDTQNLCVSQSLGYWHKAAEVVVPSVLLICASFYISYTENFSTTRLPDRYLEIKKWHPVYVWEACVSSWQKENLRKTIRGQRSEGAVLKEISLFPLFQLRSCCCDPAVSCVRICCILFRRTKLSHSLKHQLCSFAQAWLNEVLLGMQKSWCGSIVFWVAQFPLGERSRKLWKVMIFLIFCNLHKTLSRYISLRLPSVSKVLDWNDLLICLPATILTWVEGQLVVLL